MIPTRRTRASVSALVLIAIALIAIPVAPRSAWSQSPDDVYWSGSFDVPAFDAEIQDLVVWGAHLFAGGTFGQTPDGPATGIARWDGTAWQALGPGTDGGIWALVNGGGLLIAGGVFSNIGGVAASNVAAWNGIEWFPMGSGLAGQVLDLAVVDGELYAAGDFTFGAAFDHAPVARWNGSDWEPLGPVVPLGVFSRAHEVVEFAGELIVGGRFRYSGVTTVGLVLRWTGSSWDTLASGTGSVLSVVADGSTLVAGGLFSFVEGAEGPIARWNGVTWSTELPLWEGVAYELAVLSNGLHVAGLLTGANSQVAVARVTATGLEPMPWLTGTAYALAEYAGQLYVGGTITAAETSPGFQEPMFHCARLGTSWEVVGGAGRDGYGLMGLPFRGVHALLATDELYVAGSFSVARNGSRWETTGTVARWNGSTWAGLPDLAGTVMALAWYGGQLIAGGNFTGPLGIQNLAAWDGFGWMPFAGGTDDEVLALAVSGKDLYAGGRFVTAGGDNFGGIARWDGASWSHLGYADLASPRVIRALLLPSTGGLIAAGSFTRISGVPADNVARWDGTDWTAMGAGYPGEVFALADYGNEMVAGGYPSPGQAGAPVLRWSGTDWAPLGSGTGAGVQALLVTSGALFAGGDFADLGSPEVDAVARWDGIEWTPLGSGLGQRNFDYRVASALAVFEGSLYVGGGFATAGGKPSSLIARWDGLAGSIPTPGPLLSLAPGRPNPFADQVTISYSLNAPADIAIRVHDLTGRLVRHVFRGPQGIGGDVATWDGRDEDNRRQPAGVYYVSFVAEDNDPVSRKVVLLP